MNTATGQIAAVSFL